LHAAVSFGLVFQAYIYIYIYSTYSQKDILRRLEST
jgi:hypothetical protein